MKESLKVTNAQIKDLKDKLNVSFEKRKELSKNLEESLINIDQFSEGSMNSEEANATITDLIQKNNALDEEIIKMKMEQEQGDGR